MSKPEPKSDLPPLPKGPILSRVQLHQAFTIVGMTDTSLYAHKGVELVYTSDGVFGRFKETYFIIPLANVIVAYL